MATDTQLYPWILSWLATALVVLSIIWKSRATSGLLLTYTMQMFVLHWLAAALYLLPWKPTFDEATVFAGLQQSTYAIAGFAIGTGIVLPWVSRRLARSETPPHPPHADSRLVNTYLMVGVVSYGVLTPLFGSTPTVAAIVTGAASCTVLGLALGCWNAAHRKDGSLWLWAAITLLLPFVTIAVQGFLGFGLAAAGAVFAFVASFYRPRWKVLVYGVIASYLGLSLYVTYMRDRTDIRRVVWGGESIVNRLTHLEETFSQLELFDLDNVDHLDRIDVRLNQNYLVGASVKYLTGHEELFARGATVWDAVLSLIPRALWPNKPIVAGGGDLVSRYTGIRFAEGTSVGIGLVMEMYVNFGSSGVLIGFMCFGALLAYVDARSANYSALGDWVGFSSWFLPGLSLVQLGNSLLEVSASAGAAVVVALIVNRFVVPVRHSRTEWRLAHSDTGMEGRSEQRDVRLPTI
jgi:hypothetical protein